MEQIVCRDVALGYGGHIISQGIHFCVSQGDYLCIVGENGTGKSTLMKTLLGLLPPMAGEIRYSNGLHHTEIGYLPQQSHFQRTFPATAMEIALSGCLNRCGARPFYTRVERKIAEQNMEKLGITALRNRSYRELSGGQQQRILLARALCASRKLLLLDEPAAGLDPTATADMYDCIHTIQKQDGITIVMISHDIASATREATHILHLARQPLFFGPANDYLESDVGRVFLSAREGASA